MKLLLVLVLLFATVSSRNGELCFRIFVKVSYLNYCRNSCNVRYKEREKDREREGERDRELINDQYPQSINIFSVKRNAYGDEAVTPEAPSAGGYEAPAPPATVSEETAAPVDQGYGSATESGIEPSGYRKKRNVYGDEAVTPEAPSVEGYEGNVITEAPATESEETAAPVEQGYGSATESGIEPSGY